MTPKAAQPSAHRQKPPFNFDKKRPGYFSSGELLYIKINLLGAFSSLKITDFTKFETGLGQLFEILQNASDKNKMESVLKKDPAFKKIDRETAAAINLFAGMNLKVNEKDEVVDVCKAWEEQKECGKMEMLYSLVQDGTLKADKAADKANLTVT